MPLSLYFTTSRSPFGFLERIRSTRSCGNSRIKLSKINERFSRTPEGSKKPNLAPGNDFHLLAEISFMVGTRSGRSEVPEVPCEPSAFPSQAFTQELHFRAAARSSFQRCGSERLLSFSYRSTRKVKNFFNSPGITRSPAFPLHPLLSERASNVANLLLPVNQEVNPFARNLTIPTSPARRIGQHCFRPFRSGRTK